MQFKTMREQKQAQYRDHWLTGSRGRFFHFDYQLAPDPTAETVSVGFATDSFEVCPREFRPDVSIGVRTGVEHAREAGHRLCGLRLTMTFAKSHDADTTAHGVQLRVASCVRWHVPEATVPLASFAPEWLTADVVGLAKGIHADAATDRYPILSDALRDAGCEDPLIHDHLQLCPDHGTSCWVVEMILGQTRAAGT
ncbi:MAG TPA: hypothetical protein VGE74_10475 [Gemmata sp.]